MSQDDLEFHFSCLYFWSCSANTHSQNTTVPFFVELTTGHIHQISFIVQTKASCIMKGKIEGLVKQLEELVGSRLQVHQSYIMGM